MKRDQRPAPAADLLSWPRPPRSSASTQSPAPKTRSEPSPVVTDVDPLRQTMIWRWGALCQEKS